MSSSQKYDDGEVLSHESITSPKVNFSNDEPVPPVPYEMQVSQKQMSLGSNLAPISPATDASGTDLTGKSGTAVANTSALADVIEKSYKAKKRDSKAPYKEVIKDAPENQ